MAGTKAGGIKCRDTNYLKYGRDFYKIQGRKGGSKSGITKGFGCMDKERLKEIGRKGGSNSKRGKGKPYKILELNKDKILFGLIVQKLSREKIARAMDVSMPTLNSWINDKIREGFVIKIENSRGKIKYADE